MNKEERIRDLATKCADMYATKNKKYGDSFGRTVEKYGFIAALTRMSDKFNRIESLILNPDYNYDDESIIDTLMDLSTYCFMTIIEVEDKNND